MGMSKEKIMEREKQRYKRDKEIEKKRMSLIYFSFSQFFWQLYINDKLVRNCTRVLKVC